MLKGILTVGGWTLASRVFGFARDMLIAAFLGAGPVADAFFVANRLPNLFRRLFGEGAFSAAFVPAFSGLLATEGRESAQHFAQQAAAVLVVWLIGLTVLAEIFMPTVVAGLAPGFRSDPEKFALAVQLCRITFPYMPLICLGALLSGVLNGLDRYAAAAAAPVVYNIVCIIFLLGLAHLLPTAGHALAIGVSVSGVVQLGLLGWAVHRAGIRLRLPRPRLSPAIRVLLRRMGPGLIGAGVTQLNFAVDVIIASLLPAGTVSVLYYADRVNQLPLGTIGVAVGTALLPTLSRQALAGQAEAAIGTLNRALEYALLLTLPAALALLVMGGPIIEVLFHRGAFTAAQVALTGQALDAYAVGLPAFVLVKVLVPGFFARGDTAMPVKIGMFIVALNLGLNIVFMGPLQHIGPPLASSLAAWVNVVALGWVLHRRGHLALDRQISRSVPRMLLAGMAMLLVLYGLEIHMFRPLTGALRWAGLAGLVAAGMLVYGVVGQAIGGFDLRAVSARLLRRRKA
ncbi:MAG TPA: murein biosynthesis integral membrane protein MurJ [Acetobacteraceae bacterium]|nr:murein biosynthesis integral membrane protein MurJ [Acetobacteraceae bacterium]